MPYVDPVSREQLAENEPYFKVVESALGFLPGAYFTLGQRPEILRAFTSLVMAVLGPGTVDMGLKQLVSLMASVSAGCRYCQAHTAISAQRFGVPDENVAGVFDFETGDLFTDAERAALRLARDAGISPNAVTPAHFDDLYGYYSAEQIVEIVSAISLFGFLNRWNETMSSELEPEPLAYAASTLSTVGWTAGKHAPQTVTR